MKGWKKEQILYRIERLQHSIKANQRSVTQQNDIEELACLAVELAALVKEETP